MERVARLLREDPDAARPARRARRVGRGDRAGSIRAGWPSGAQRRSGSVRRAAARGAPCAPAGALAVGVAAGAVVMRRVATRRSGATRAAGRRRRSIKGLKPSLTVYRRTPHGQRDAGRRRRSPRPAICCASATSRPDGAYGVIVSIDGRGVVTLHLPPNGERAATLRPATARCCSTRRTSSTMRRAGSGSIFVTGGARRSTVEPILDAARRAGRAGSALAAAVVAAAGRAHAVHVLAAERGQAVTTHFAVGVAASLAARWRCCRPTRMPRSRASSGSRSSSARTPAAPSGRASSTRSPTPSASRACWSSSAASAPANEIVLRQPRLKELVDALDRLSARVDRRAPRARAAGRTEVLLYYSGHADEQGLLLGDDRYSYRTLRDRLDQIPADVRIAVLDACASGAFTRLKGGQGRGRRSSSTNPPTMRGHAFLTSSAETEAAQESDRIRASYFTHYLVSGLPRRRRSVGRRQGHAQRGVPVRVQRDARPDGGHQGRRAASVVRHQPVGHRRRRDDRRPPDERDARARRGAGRPVLRPQRRAASWSSSCTSRAAAAWSSASSRAPTRCASRSRSDRCSRRPTCTDGGAVVLDATQFGAVAVESHAPARRRRGARASPSTAETVSRSKCGMWRTRRRRRDRPASATIATSSAGSSTRATCARISSIAISVPRASTEIAASAIGREGMFTGIADDHGRRCKGSRWNPLRRDASRQAVKPFVAAGLGPVIGSSVGTFSARGARFAGVNDAGDDRRPRRRRRRFPRRALVLGRRQRRLQLDGATSRRRSARTRITAAPSLA